MSRKKICKLCNKIVSDEDYHECEGRDKKRLAYNAQKREYYRKNKETLKLIQNSRWRKLRLLIINRDGNRCQRCFIKYAIINGDELQVHHIKPRINFPELTYDESNLVTLCKTCNIQLGLSGIDFEWHPPIDEQEFNI